MRNWRERTGSTRVPGASRGNSGANWGGRGNSGANWGGRGNSGANWGGRDADDAGYGRGSGRYRADDYQGIEQDRALVPSATMMPGMMPNDMAVGAPGMVGVPGMPTEEEERLLGIRHPVYIPALGDKRKGRISRFRIISGVFSIILMCAVSAGAVGVFGQKYLTDLRKATGIQNTPTTLNLSQVPVTPVTTPGPANKYITSVVTAKHIDGSQNARDITSHFIVNDQVFVVIQIRNAPKGTHTVCVQWSIDSSQGMQAIHPPGEWVDKKGCDSITSAGANAAFALIYPQAGVGMARIFWDRPASDTDPQAGDPALADTIYFSVLEPATPTPVVPTVTPTVKPGTTPSPSPKTGMIGLPDVAWIGRPTGA